MGASGGYSVQPNPLSCPCLCLGRCRSTGRSQNTPSSELDASRHMPPARTIFPSYTSPCAPIFSRLSPRCLPCIASVLGTGTAPVLATGCAPLAL